jgi:polysaccharide export outer membrane protein
MMIQQLRQRLRRLRAGMSHGNSRTLGLATWLGLFLVLGSACNAGRGGAIPYDVKNFGVPDAPRAALSTADYKIATGDTLAITVFQVEALSKPYRVDLAGNIAVPLIGDVAAVGKTTSQLGSELAQRLGARYLRNPNVTVAVAETTNNLFTIEGGVRRSGMFPVTGPLTLVQAIAMGGGVETQSGNPRRVAIFRQIQGQRMAAAFDLVSIRSGEMKDPDVFAGDIVVVESNTRRSAFQEILGLLPLYALFRPF